MAHGPKPYRNGIMSFFFNLRSETICLDDAILFFAKYFLKLWLLEEMNPWITRVGKFTNFVVDRVQNVWSKYITITAMMYDA